jgi:amidase
MASTWQDAALKQKARVAEAIPPEWRLKSIPTTDSVMSVPKESGILTPEELAITEAYAADLVKDLATGKLSSVAVTTAFCKRAALAHQLVGECCKSHCRRVLTPARSTVYMTFFPTLRLQGRGTWMTTWLSTGSHLGHYTGCPSR